MNWIFKLAAVAFITSLLMACGGGSSSAPPTVNVTGEWKGTARDAGTGSTGPMTFSLNQVAADVGGSFSSPNSTCLKVGSISGSVSGNEFTGKIASGDATGTFIATVIGNAMSGTYEAKSATCGSAKGSINMTR
jgi:hypothetical protein